MPGHGWMSGSLDGNDRETLSAIHPGQRGIQRSLLPPVRLALFSRCQGLLGLRCLHVLHILALPPGSPCSLAGRPFWRHQRFRATGTDAPPPEPAFLFAVPSSPRRRVLLPLPPPRRRALIDYG